MISRLWPEINNHNNKQKGKVPGPHACFCFIFLANIHVPGINFHIPGPYSFSAFMFNVHIHPSTGQLKSGFQTRPLHAVHVHCLYINIF